MNAWHHTTKHDTTRYGDVTCRPADPLQSNSSHMLFGTWRSQWRHRNFGWHEAIWFRSNQTQLEKKWTYSDLKWTLNLSPKVALHSRRRSRKSAYLTSKIVVSGVISGVISSTESKPEVSWRIHFVPIPLTILSESDAVQAFRQTNGQNKPNRWTNQTRPRIEHCDWLVLALQLPIPTVYFSLCQKQRSYKRHNWNWYCAFDGVGLIFTESYS